jgi:peptidoglycan/xylan/chitin deacetylase (PgdA/CDA1 family)
VISRHAAGPRTRSRIDTALVRSPAQPLFMWRAERHLAVLAYHGIESPERFEAQIATIRRTANPVSLDDVIASITKRTGLPRRAVLITFDDGDPSMRDSALPLLREAQIPGVAFVVAGVIGTDEPLWWNEVRDLVSVGGTARGLEGVQPHTAPRSLKGIADQYRREAIDQLRRSARVAAQRTPQLSFDDLRLLESGGISIGNHSLTHPCLDQCADERIEFELETAHEILRRALGHHPTAFAYPNGDWDDRVRKAVQGKGYPAAFLFDHRLAAVPLKDPLRISRLRVNSTDSVERLRLALSGLHPAVHRLRTLGGRRRISGRWADLPEPAMEAS